MFSESAISFCLKNSIPSLFLEQKKKKKKILKRKKKKKKKNPKLEEKEE